MEDGRPHLLLGVIIRHKLKRPLPSGFYTERHGAEKASETSPTASSSHPSIKKAKIPEEVANPMTSMPNLKVKAATKDTQPENLYTYQPKKPEYTPKTEALAAKVSLKDVNDPIIKEYALADPTQLDVPSPSGKF